MSCFARLCHGKGKDGAGTPREAPEVDGAGARRGLDGSGLRDPAAADGAEGAGRLPEVGRLEESMSHVALVEDGPEVQELYPGAKQALSIRGCRPHGQQTAFTERSAELFPGFELFGSMGLGCVCKKGLKPESPNQDDFCFLHADGVSVFGVFDGHGPYGDDVAACVQEFLPRCLIKTHDLEDNPLGSLRKAFVDAHDHVCSRLDCQLSGTTATVIVHQADEDILHIGNVGDSRAVLCRKVDNKFVGEELTVDHYPSLKREAKRIKDSGEGQVRRMQGEKQERVFLTGKIYPGLATTRSIGDQVGVRGGVTCKPEVKSVTKGGPKDDWEFLLICTDGVWQKMTTQEAIDIIGKHKETNAQRAAENLATSAWNRWVEEEENVVDDITVQCFFFKNVLRCRADATVKAKKKEAAKSKNDSSARKK